MQNFLNRWAKIILLACLVAACIYLGGSWFYSGRFLPGSHVGNIPLSHLTPVQAQNTLNQTWHGKPVSFSEDGQDLGYIELGQIHLTLEDDNELQEAMDQQNPWTWPFAWMVQDQAISLKEDLAVDLASLESLLQALGVENSQRQASQSAYIEKLGGDFELAPEVYGQQVSGESLRDAIYHHLVQGQHQLDLSQAYIQPQVTQEDPLIRQQMEIIQAYLETSMTMTFDGKEVTIPKEAIADWIILEDQAVDLDLEAIEDYIYSVNQEHASLFQYKPFYSTYRGEVWVQPGTYGWYIDRFSTAETIRDYLEAGGDYRWEPAIGGSGYGMDYEIGYSYVEVDLVNQMMLIYIEGNLVLDTPIVSGISGENTVPGAYQVWQKLTDTTLVGTVDTIGYDYEQPVSYWIAFDDNAQGIHDASWQSHFGGNVYLTDGSLGCINTPPSIMPTVFEYVWIGMPVIVI